MTEDQLEISQPEGFQIKRVDRYLLQQDFKNKDYITEELINAYGDLEYFFDNGIAYVAIKDNELAARADMLFCDNGYGNISVNTVDLYRRKGLSGYLVMKTIEDMRKQGLVPIWDCTEDNIASEKTALKCGFHIIRKDIIYWFVPDAFVEVAK